jgi:hypothetical protein
MYPVPGIVEPNTQATWYPIIFAPEKLENCMPAENSQG